MPRKIRSRKKRNVLKQKFKEKVEEKDFMSLNLTEPDNLSFDSPFSDQLNNASFEEKETTNSYTHNTPTFEEESSDIYNSYDTPFDLSLKSRHHDITSSNTVEPDNTKSELEVLEEAGLTPHQLLLVHLSKVQHHLLTNFFQYQAAFLTHFQNVQHQILAKDPKVLSDDDTAEKDVSYSDNGSQPNKEETPSCPIDQLASPSGLPPQLLLNLLAAQNLYSNASSLPLLPRLLSLAHSSIPLNTFPNVGNPYLAALSSLPYAFKIKPEDVSKNEGEEETQPGDNFMQSEATNKDCTLTDPFEASLLKASISLKDQDTSTVESDHNEDADFSTSNLQFKRKRIAFSAQQYEILQTTFEHNNFPEPADQQCIARQLKAPYRSIKMWFQNKRANARKKLVPGEKGSGRAANGDKIPGDTDTRFYCDKCPAAFICQKYLNNHYEAHKIFVTKCPKCNVVFTHECLLKTHILSKCGKSKLKLCANNYDKDISCKKIKRTESSENLVNSENDSTFEQGCTGKAKTDKVVMEAFSPAILTQLNSSLPLLTLLQLQKKHLQGDQHVGKFMLENQLKKEIEENSDPNTDNSKVNSLEKGDDLKVSNNKYVPPLIPSDLVSHCSDTSKFAILRHLLTNFQDNNSRQEINPNDIGEDKQDEAQHSDEEMEPANANDSQAINCKPTKNIPPQLLHLFQSKEESCHSNDESDVEINNTHRTSSPSGSELYSQVDPVADFFEEGKTSEKRKHDSEFGPKEDITAHKAKGPKQKRLRRRTTVFTEAQHRVLYLHFTQCNFPDPSMFRILSKLTNLNPHVIKIWFQNERSRQRRQVMTDPEGIAPREKKPYKCRDCGVEFAMPAFLVKHCLRHIPTDNVTSLAKKCPICMVEFDSQKLHSHFMASHNLSVNTEEDGGVEENVCHLCEQNFNDLNALSEHKYEHLKETKYGDPPQCFECKTTFVNVLCLESHMATHHKFKWDHVCQKCHMSFYDKILLESHMISHNLSEKINDTTHSHSEYLNTLMQHISDSKMKSIKSKPEDSNSLSANIPGINSLPKLKIKLEDKDSTEESTAVDKAGLDGSDICQLKFVPVHFIPVTSSQPNGHTNLSTIFQSSNVSISPPPLCGASYSLDSSPIVQKDLSSKAPSSFGDDSLPSNCEKIDKLKKLPKLIPICDASQVSDENSNAVMTTYENEDSVQIEIKEERDEALDENADENEDASSFLVYTPYAAEYRKRRRTPTHFNASQRDILEAYYKYDNFPDPNEQLKLSEYLQVPYSVIKTWFQNTRKNHRKHLKESYKFEEGGPFECLDCRVCFVSKVYLDTHIRQHQEHHPFKCAICAQCFPHKAVYDIHLKIGCSKKMKKRYDHLKQGALPSHPNEPIKKNSPLSSTILDKGIPPDQSFECTKTHFKCKIDNANLLNLKLIKMESCSPADDGETTCAKKMSRTLKLQQNEDFYPIHNKNGQNTKEQNDPTSKSISINSFSPNHSDTCESPGKSDSSDLNDKCHSNVMSPVPYTHKVLGYTCQDCNQIFSTFLSFTEHKEKKCPVKSKTSVNLFDDLHLNSDINSSSQDKSPMNGSMLFNCEKLDYSIGSKGKDNDNLNTLHLHYEYNNFPSSLEINLIAKRLKVEREVVAYWFQKRRNKECEEKSNGYKLPQQCHKCTSVFVHKEALFDHEKSVHNSTDISIKFVCPEESCQIAFPNSSLLETHRILHTEKLAIKEVPYDFKKHISFLETHYKENNFPSPMDVGFMARRLSVPTMGIHWWFKERRLKHMQVLEKVQDLSNRDTEDSSLELNSFECRICDAAFLDPTALDKHERIHVSNVSLMCIECSLEFANPLSLETHLLSHGISSPKDILSTSKCIKGASFSKFKCSYAQLKVLYCHFKQCNVPKKEDIKLLSRRLRIPAKSLNSWFKYERQNRSLKLFPNLNNPHSSKKQVSEQVSSCTFCSAQFSSAQYLDHHNRMHGLGYKFSCKICSECFIHETILDTHSLSHNPQSVKQASKNMDKKLKLILKEFVSDFYDGLLHQRNTEETSGPTSDEIAELPLNRGDIIQWDINHFESKHLQNSGEDPPILQTSDENHSETETVNRDVPDHNPEEYDEDDDEEEAKLIIDEKQN